MLGPIGREIFGFFYWLHITAVAGSGLLSFSVALNAVSLHATCTVVFVVVGLVLGFMLSSIQTLNKISWIGWSGLISIMVAIITVCIAVGVQDRPSEAPATGPWDKETAASRSPGFVGGMNALNTAVFAFSVTPYYFNIIGEMKDPRKFTRTACLTQGFVTATYLTISVVVYYYVSLTIDES
jgi:amino acid permease